MAWLIWTLFESPIALAIPLALLNFALLVHWRRSGKPRPLLVGLALALVLLVAQGLVVTGRERAAAILTRIERDVRAARIDTLAEVLDGTFQADELTRAEFLDRVQRALKQNRVAWLQRLAFDVVESTRNSFTVDVAYIADVTTPDYAGRVTSSWSLTFARTPAGWRIRNVLPRRINRTRFSTWRELWRLTGGG